MINPTGHALSVSSTTLTTAQQNLESDAVTDVDAAVTVTESVAAEKATNHKQPSTPFDKHAAAYASEWEKSTLDKALETLNQDMQAWATGLRFDIDPDTQRIVLSVVDNDSGEVIRTVPSEAVMAVAKMIAKFQGKGINTKA